MNKPFLHRAGAITAASIIAASGTTAQAQDTWVGGGADNNFSTNANWLDGTAPAIGAANTLTFDTSVAFLAPNVQAPYSGITSILFDNSGTGAFVIGGSSLSFTGGASITNNTVGVTQTINNDLVISDTGLTFDAAAGDLVFGGATLTNGGFTLTVLGGNNTTINNAISGAGGLTMNGAGTLTLGGTNTYTGATSVTAGTVNLTGSSTGSAITVNGGTFDVVAGGDIAGSAAITLTTGNFNVNGTISGNNAITVTAGTFDITATGSLTGNGTLDANGGNTNINGTISGNTVITVNGGALDITSTGSITGNGALTLTTGTLDVNGSIDGNNAITVNGGMFDLTSTGSLTGNGTLAADGGTTNVNGAITGDTTITVNGGAFDLTSTGSITGNGAFTLTTGTATVSGTMSGTNAITLNGGTFDLNFGGSITGDGGITINAGSTFNVNTGGTVNTVADLNFVAGTFLIDGTVTTTGGTTTIAGTTTGGGSVNINGSTLELTGDFGGSAALNLTSGTYNFSGTSTVTTTGNTVMTAGTLTFSGTSDFGGTGNLTINGGTVVLGVGTTISTTGLTTLNGGSMVLNGMVTNNFENFATVTGIGGTVTGDFTNFAGSTLNPGTAGTIGTFNVGNDFVINLGADLTLDISKDGGGTVTNDLIIVGNDALFGPTSTITLNDLGGGGTFAVGDVIVVTNATTSSQDFGLVVVDTFTFLNFTVNINGTNLELVATAAANFANAATTPNNLAIGTALDTDAPAAAGSFLTYVTALNALGAGAPINNALQASSPLAFASLADANIRMTQQQSRVLSDYMRSRRTGVPLPSGFSGSPSDLQFASAAVDPTTLALAIRQAQPGRQGQRQRSGISAPSSSKNNWEAWGTIFGVFSDQDTRVGYAGYQADSFGGQFGVDTTIDANLTVGLMIGLSTTEIDFAAGGDGDVDTFRIGPYLSWEPSQNLIVDASFTYGNHSHDVDRMVSFAGFTGTATSSFDAEDFSIYTSVGYTYETGDLDYTPFVSFNYSSYDSDAYTETGGGGAALSVASRDLDSLRVLLGVRASTIYERTGSFTLIPEAYLAWGSELLDPESIEATFVGGATQFATDPDDPDESIHFGVGASMLIRAGMSAFLRYDGEVNSDGDVHAISGGLNVRF